MTNLLKKALSASSIGALGMAAALTAGTAMAEVNVPEGYENYWEGKTVTINIRSTAGGGYDSHGRLMARHLGKYLPGNPNVVAVNRPGAGGIVAANHLYRQADNDGTEILIAARELALADRMGTQGVQYNALEMPPLGSPVSDNRVWLTSEDTGVRNLEDLMNYDGTFRFAVSGPGAGSAQMVDLLERAGYPVDIVTGYEGTGDQVLAVLRGEVQGQNSTYPAQRQLIQDEGLVILAKLGNHPELAEFDDVRDVLEGDFRALANILAAPLLAGRPFFTAPGTPEPVLDMMRQAFELTVNDPDYVRELAQMDEEVSFTGPDEITEAFEQTMNAPDDIIELFTED